MPLDPVIAAGYQGVQLPNPLEGYARVMQIQQAQQENALARMNMERAQREEEVTNRLRSLDPTSPNYQTEVMRINPELGSQLMLRSKQQIAAERAAAASKAELRGKNLTYWQGLARDSARTPTDDVLVGLARRAVELGIADEGTATSQLQQIIALPPEQRSQVLSQFGAQAAAAPVPAAPTRLQDRFVPVGKMVFDRETQQYISPPQSAAVAPQVRAAAPAAPGVPAAKPLTAQQETQRRDKLGKEFKAATNALQTTQDVLDSIQMVKDAPGLSRATGYTGVYTPSFSEGAAAQAETRFQNLKGKVTALGKAQAAASGAIGSIANQEWKILSDQIAALELVKGTGPLLEQLGLVEAQAQGAMERIRDQYQRQFGEDFERFPQFRDIPQPKSTVKGRKSSGIVTPAAPAAPATTNSGATVSNW